MEIVASLSQGRTAAAQCGLFTYKSVPVIFEPPCNLCKIFHKRSLPIKTSCCQRNDNRCSYSINRYSTLELNGRLCTMRYIAEKVKWHINTESCAV